MLTIHQRVWRSPTTSQPAIHHTTPSSSSHRSHAFTPQPNATRASLIPPRVYLQLYACLTQHCDHALQHSALRRTRVSEEKIPGVMTLCFIRCEDCNLISCGIALFGHLCSQIFHGGQVWRIVWDEMDWWIGRRGLEVFGHSGSYLPSLF